jgi:hypothetical protein
MGDVRNNASCDRQVEYGILSLELSSSHPLVSDLVLDLTLGGSSSMILILSWDRGSGRGVVE